MKNIIVINYLAILYSIVIVSLTYIFFRDFASWTVLGVATALFNHSLMVRFTKNKVTKDLMFLLIAFKYLIYLIMLGFMFFLLREDTQELSYGYIFFLLGAINVKIGIFIFHLPFKAFKKLREDAIKEKEEENDVASIS